MNLKKLYVKSGVAGCVSALEFACLYLHDAEKREVDIKGSLYYRIAEGSADGYFDLPKLQDGRDLGVWMTETPRGKVKLTDFGKAVVENTLKRLESEPKFDLKSWKKEQDRLRREKEKAKGQTPGVGELIYLRSKARMQGDWYNIKNGETIYPMIALDRYAWPGRENGKLESKPYAVIGNFTADDKHTWPHRKKTFTLIMVKGQAFAVQPEAIQKRRPGGQGLNKRKKKSEKK